MSDGMVLVLIGIMFTLVPFLIQTALCLFVRVRIIKWLPFILFVPIWWICLMASCQYIELPFTSFLSNGSFIAFSDYSVITVLGIPILIGLSLAVKCSNIIKK